MIDDPLANTWKWQRRLAKFVVFFALFLGGAYGLLRWYQHYRYPYGWSHSCISILGLALTDYAESHDGFFPRGEATPEASLSLLAAKELHFADEPESAVQILRGKTAPAEKARARLAAGELLDPETCGWHYVEGLTLKDDSELAIAWDKVGLGHNGERLFGGGREVWFVRGPSRIVDGKEWPEFLKRQDHLLASRSEAAQNGQPDLVASVKLPGGEIVDQYSAPWTLSIDSADGNSSRMQSGTALSPRILRWFDLKSEVDEEPPRMFIFKLSLAKMQSQPVEVEVSPDVVKPDAITFEMQDPE